MAGLSDRVGALIAVIIIAVLVAGFTYVDYHMFKRAHPSAGVLEYLWERNGR